MKVQKMAAKPQNIAPKGKECAHGVETFRAGGYPQGRSKPALSQPQASGQKSGKRG